MLNSPRLDFVFCICLHFPFGEGLYAPALLFSSARVLFHFSYLIPPLPLFPPLFPWLGAIRSRAAIFELRVCFSISHISLSLFFFFFPLYASTLPSVRGYTLARCCFSFARVRFPFPRCYSPFCFPLHVSTLPSVRGYTLARCCLFICARAFSISHTSLYPVFFFCALYASTLPSVRGYTLARCSFSFARVRFPFLRY